AAAMLSLAVGGAATWWCAVRRKWRYAPLPIAVEFNLLACALVGLTLLDKAADSRPLAAAALVAGFAIYAGAIVTRPLIRHDDVGSGLGRHPLALSLANVLATLGIATAAGVAIASGAQPWKIARLVLAAIATLLALGAVAAAVVPLSHNDAGAAAALRSAVIA